MTPGILKYSGKSMRDIVNRLAGCLACVALAASCQPGFATESEPLQLAGLEEIQVWASAEDKAQATGPTSLLTPADMVSINIATTEDVVKYEPSLVIRRRFIGDANGTMGMRGSNMFQTSRSMVFADGVPLHYLLQSRWNGAPRWTLVSASEIAQVEVLYGPFSAEYSGNAMGGVVQIETAIPQEREFHFDGSFFSQTFDDYGFDDTVNGYKTFASYGDRVGDFNLYLSYNHLENESQPQTFYFGSGSSNATPEPVSGAIPGNDETGDAQLFFGDTGVVETKTDNLKFKAGYEFNQWFALLNVAYEDRHSANNAPNSYVRDAQGNLVWSGHVIQDGQTFFIPASRLNVSEMDRQSLSTGLRLRGELTDKISLEASLSKFDILQDETRSSAVNSNDPAHTPAGEVVNFEDTGWQTAEVKLWLNDTGVDGLDLVAGVRHEAYELNLDIYDSDDYAAGSKGAFSSRSGGETSLFAVFTQLNWDVNQQWDVSLGGRYESWESRNGYFSNDDPATAAFELENVPGRSNDQFSPKFSLGYQSPGSWAFRYSLAKAYRFPIVEELFSQYQAFNAISVANPELKPEDGLHHNLMVERALDLGYVRINLFQETIEGVIESQATTLPGGLSVRTFIPIDEVETRGLEFIVNVESLFVTNLDIRFNLAYTDAEIVKNAADPSIEGNIFPRMPKWRGNLLATYHISGDWDVGASLQYASDSYGRLDNTDDEDNVYGAQDGYSRIGLKTNYNPDQNLKIGFGVDNLTDEIAYVAHPWPGRTFYVNMSYDL